MNDSTYTPVMANRKQEAYRIALALYQQKPDWVTFFREILGIGGVVRRLFSEDTELLEFESTEEHSEIQLMLARLRQNSNRGETQEPTRVITVRLPQSLHATLLAEAHLHQTSMNKLCISKLLRVIDNEFTDQTRDRLQTPISLAPPTVMHHNTPQPANTPPTQPTQTQPTQTQPTQTQPTNTPPAAPPFDRNER